MVNLFDNLKTKDKFLIARIILSMLASKNEENKQVIYILFMQQLNLIKNILFECSDGENIKTVAAILDIVKTYPNFAFFKDLNDLYIFLL